MCTVVRGDLPVSIRWFKDSQPVSGPEGYGSSQAANNYGQQTTIAATTTTTAITTTNSVQDPFLSSSSSVAIKQLDPYSSTLTFSSLQSHHRGVYTCEAQNEAGKANQSSSLVIHGEYCL